MTVANWILRSARAEDWPQLVAIDDDASTLYAEAGRGVDLAPDHPFVLAEQERWREALDAGRVVLAVTEENEAIGFVSLGYVDGAPHVQQLSVRRAWMRRGVGRALMERALAWAGDVLWLTTYSDLPWNRAFYERIGFACVDARRCGPEMRETLAEERSALPAPEQRVAMLRRAS